MRQLIITILFLSLYTFSFSQEVPVYSFFTAGHAYGNPNNFGYGLHPPFVEYFPKINQNQHIKFGVLTGDIVAKKEIDYWESTEKDIHLLKMPIHVAAGNHDISEEFLKRFNEYFYKFYHENDLFIILTPGLDKWNISGDQFTFLKNTLDSNSINVSNIFIFMHELIWWSPTNDYSEIKINYAPHYPGINNYESVIKPLLLSYSNPFFVFTGDLGATWESTPYMYDHFDNITLIGSGMGGGDRDNIIVTNVFQDSIYFDLVSLNGDNQKKLGELQNYSIHASEDFTLENTIQLYPNPCEEKYTIVNKSSADLSFSMYTSYGALIETKKFYAFSNLYINTIGLNPGIYFVKLQKNKTVLVKRIVIR